ncbi:RNA polymerase sigma factor SigJ [Lentzea sp. NPDC051838]|uniref:RNA polymerase sigma factor SigJ n=1 Tax=Lentzea sp. NPDC051838 TaxID=3154849 RepID=UPI0034493EB8
MTDVVLEERRHLINLAYRLLGSLAEAEDAVQEAYARWYALSQPQQEAIVAPGAWLTTVTSRICLDLLGSARHRRESYVGSWIPEPLPDPAEGHTADPADRVTLDESVGMAFMVALESMTPAQRVALVLHDVFRYSFAEIAEITGRTPAACRELASSARRRVRAFPPPAASAGRQTVLVRDFKQAWETQDIAALVGLLDPDAVFTADGGGKVLAALEPIVGGEEIIAFLLRVANSVVGDFSLLERTVNGQAGLLVRYHGVISSVYAFDVEDDRITRIWAVRNPSKLRPWIS